MKIVFPHSPVKRESNSTRLIINYLISHWWGFLGLCQLCLQSFRTHTQCEGKDSCALSQAVPLHLIYSMTLLVLAHNLELVNYTGENLLTTEFTLMHYWES